jgi:hypothetical protein
VLSATGNLRALLSGLIFVVSSAQAALSGALAPLRQSISAWWTIEGGSGHDLLAWTNLGHVGGLIFGLTWLASGVFFCHSQSLVSHTMDHSRRHGAKCRRSLVVQLSGRQFFF